MFIYIYIYIYIYTYTKIIINCMLTDISFKVEIEIVLEISLTL